MLHFIVYTTILRRITMKRLFVCFVLLLFVAGIAYAKDFEVKKKAGEYNVEVKIDKNPPIAGENNLEIQIKDAAGKNLSDAKVSVNYSMPAMPGMPPMNYKTEAELKGNTYKAKMNLSMAGPWQVAVKITRAGKKAAMKFAIDAH
jgi:hypothetical protein